MEFATWGGGGGNGICHLTLLRVLCEIKKILDNSQPIPNFKFLPLMNT